MVGSLFALELRPARTQGSSLDWRLLPSEQTGENTGHLPSSLQANEASREENDEGDNVL
jgi:hypothetical protein